MKPAKIVYENQEIIWNKVKVLLDKIIEEDCVKEAYVWGSLAERKFGIYERPYKNRTGSDIDVVIIVDEIHDLSKKWRFTGITKSWFDLYDLGIFEHNGHIHPIDGLIVFPSRHDLNIVNKNLKDRSKLLYRRSANS